MRRDRERPASRFERFLTRKRSLIAARNHGHNGFDFRVRVDPEPDECG